MPRNQRPLTRISDHLDDLDDDIRLAFADGRITAEEAARIRARMTAVAGLVSCQDAYEMAADAIRNQGFTAHARRMVRQAERAHETLGWRLLDGGRDGDGPDDGSSALAA